MLVTRATAIAIPARPSPANSRPKSEGTSRGRARTAGRYISVGARGRRGRREIVLPAAAERAVELHDIGQLTKLGLHQRLLRRIELLLGLQHLEVARQPDQIAIE